MNIDKSLVAMYQKDLQNKRNEIASLKDKNFKLTLQNEALIKEIEMLKAMQEQKEGE